MFAEVAGMRRGQVDVLLRCSIGLKLSRLVEATSELLVRAGALVQVHTLGQGEG